MATLDSEVGFGAQDAQGSSAKTTAVYLKDVGGTDKLTFKDVTAELSLDQISTVIDHNDTANRNTDGHNAGEFAYLTAARHLSSHDGAFNNALTISGAIEGDVTVGAHVANAKIHYLRPVQTVTVAEGGTGQFATIAAALAEANGKADSSTPYEVAVYPGVYDENNLTVGHYVSIRSVVPDGAVISSSSANFLIKCEGSHYLSGIFFNNTGAGGVLQVTAPAGGTIQIDNCALQSIGNTGDVLDFNGKWITIFAFNTSELISEGGLIVTNKTNANAFLSIRGSSINFTGQSAPTPAVIDIDNNLGTLSDEILGCNISAVNLSGGATPSAFFDWGANDLVVRDSRFSIKSAAGFTFNAILCRSGTATVQGCEFNWTAEAGTPFDFNAGSGATIQHAATVYDVDKVTGAGTVIAMSEGKALFDAVEMTGQLSITADDNPLLDLTPSGTGNTDVIKITPSGALAGANTWRGFNIIGDALDPAAGGASVFGGHIDLSDVSQTNNPLLCGLLIEMPASATTSADFHAIKMTGNGQELILLNKGFLIDLTATSSVPLQATLSDAATNTIANAAVFKHLTSADMVDGFGVGFCFHIEDDASGDQTIAKIEAFRVDGLDDAAGMRFSGGSAGATPFLEFAGDGGGVTLPFALGAGQGLFFGTGTGEIYEDGTGLVIDDAGQDPLIIGDTVAIKLGDAAGVEQLQILDSNAVAQMFVVSTGEVFAGAFGFVGDTNTRLTNPAVDVLGFLAGNVEIARAVEAAQDEFVVNEGGLDIDTRLEAVGAANAFFLDGADGAISMSEKLTVGSAVAAEILVVSDGTKRVARGYDGVPHDKVFGDSQFQVLAGDTDSDMALVAKGDGAGLGRLRSITSDGTKFIQMYHDETRGVIASNSGPIRMNDETEFNAKISYTSSGGQSCGGISVLNNAVATAIAVATTPVQFLFFDTNDPSNGDITPDHTNDHLTAVVAGKYLCIVSATMESVSAGTQLFGMTVNKNNGAAAFDNVHAHRIFQGGAGDLGSLSASGIIDLAASDTIELWLVNESTTGNILISDCTMTLLLVAGT